MTTSSRARAGSASPLRVTILAACAGTLAGCAGTGQDAAPAGEPQVVIVGADSAGIRPLTIAVDDAILDDLAERLARTRLPDQIPDTGWDYGTDRTYLEGLLAYWRDGYDWRAQERALNEVDHFVTEVDGIDVHFVHQRSARDDAMPLLLIHGWPGSFVEFMDLIGPLTDPAATGGDPADAFHVVVPSLPGYAFSEKPAERGYNPERMADVLAALMEQLGYERYGVQGGDWGGIIGRSLAGNYPDNVVGFHTNFVLAGPPAGAADPNEGVPTEEVSLRLERAEAFSEGRGYQQIQGTKPQTLGYGLNDSPAGLAAWIVEKFHGWSDHGGDVEEAFSKDLMLTNIMLYWVTGSITSSTRIYYENGHAPSTRPVRYVEVPTGAAIFPKEISFAPRRWAEQRYNIVRWTMMPRGGHFAALEEPELLLEDVRAFFGPLR